VHEHVPVWDRLRDIYGKISPPAHRRAHLLPAPARLGDPAGDRQYLLPNEGFTAAAARVRSEYPA
jgi:hypothetical protein